MQARASRTKTTPEEEREGMERTDVAIIPLAIPLLSGPGSIATVMVLMSQHHEPVYWIPVYVSIVITTLLTWLMLRGADWLERHLSRTLMNVVMRVMGLILASISVEFVVAGVRDILPTLHR
jgi:multiple antibiotic resistance protein